MQNHDKPRQKLATQLPRFNAKIACPAALLLLTLIPVASTRASIETPQSAPTQARQVRLRDISSFEGVRDNLLIGYGLVAGLKRTGDSQQTFFSTQTLANILARMGLQIPVSSVQIRNVAAVMVTATLPPFARPGTHVDVTVSSIGDAKSIEGGILLLTPLHASDGQVFAEAQGPLTIAGYTAGTKANSVVVNQPTVGLISNGAIVERDSSVDLSHITTVSLLLNDPDFAVSDDAAIAINKVFGNGVAHAVDGSRVSINPLGIAPDGIPALLAKIEDIAVNIPPVAKVVINERTGTVVLGRDVSLGACSILQGSLAVDITTTYQVSQPAPFSPNGQTATVPQTNVQAQSGPAQEVTLKEGATVEDLVRGLQAIGATSHDIVAILQAIKAAGALQADLEVI
ncbi:MAG TPA: flagellar basal body P-ring protein FlgI [Bryocella sp.]|nr:flagellar basal body P-ring protein FlgI [Bryocella sp.]